MNSLLTRTALSLILFSIVLPVNADSHQRAHGLIQKSIEAHGGKGNWENKGTMIVRETQTRYTNNDEEVIQLTHYMDTRGRGYRVEIKSQQEDLVYGWDGEHFWAMSNGKAGDAELLREARRVISNSFYRLSVPFILDDPGAELEFEGTEDQNGTVTEIVKITYNRSPAAHYWTSADRHTQGGHGRSGHGSQAGHHHAGNEIYYYYFDVSNYTIAKIYFSHHGDGDYETFLFDDYKNIDGIMKEHQRKLIRANGQVNYDAVFHGIEFRQDIDIHAFYKAPANS